MKMGKGSFSEVSDYGIINKIEKEEERKCLSL